MRSTRGGGKAEQIFLRGFDADHGTDVAINVDGTPVNMVSHAHGQGYADLHYLIPEVVEQMNVRKGPYAAQDGDLATAGAIEFRTKDRLLGKAEVRGGSFETGRALALIPFGGDATKFGGYAAGAYSQTNGPFIAPQNFKAGNGMVRMTAPLGRNTRLTFTGSGYGASWEASGQIPSRAVNDGTIPRFGAVDATEGGNTHRYEASVAIGGEGSGGSQWSARVFGVNYYLNLFSNFTFFLVDSTNGDGIEQRDDRMLYGALGSYERPTQYGSVRGNLALGVTLRMDNAEVALFNQVARTRLDTRIANNINQQNGARVGPAEPRVRPARHAATRASRRPLSLQCESRQLLPAWRRAPGQRHLHAGPHQSEGQPDLRGGALHHALRELRDGISLE